MGGSRFPSEVEYRRNQNLLSISLFHEFWSSVHQTQRAVWSIKYEILKINFKVKVLVKELEVDGYQATKATGTAPRLVAMVQGKQALLKKKKVSRKDER